LKIREKSKEVEMAPTSCCKFKRGR